MNFIPYDIINSYKLEGKCLYKYKEEFALSKELKIRW